MCEKNTPQEFVVFFETPVHKKRTLLINLLCFLRHGYVKRKQKTPHRFVSLFRQGGVVRTESPSRALRRSARNTPRPGQDGTPAQSADPRTPTRPTADPKTPARAAADTWKESMEEMKKWQAGTSHTKNARGSSAKKRLGSVVEVSSTKETSPQTLDKASLSSEVKEQAGVSAASSAVSPSSDKSKSDKSAAEVEGLESHQEESESRLKETKEVNCVCVCVSE